MPATGEVFAFPEGKLYLWPSASGNASGSGVGFARDSTIRFTYGWKEYKSIDDVYVRLVTAKRAELSINSLLCDQAIFRLAQASAAVNAKFEGSIGGLTQSAMWVLYSGAIDQAGFSQSEGQLFQGNYTMHANIWSAFGQ